jgi:hypothetical protein
MLGLESIVAGARLRGVAGPAVVEVVRVEWIGPDALNVVYRSTDGPAEVLLFRDAEPRLELVQASRASAPNYVRRRVQLGPRRKPPASDHSQGKRCALPR